MHPGRCLPQFRSEQSNAHQPFGASVLVGFVFADPGPNMPIAMLRAVELCIGRKWNSWRTKLHMPTTTLNYGLEHTARCRCRRCRIPLQCLIPQSRSPVVLMALPRHCLHRPRSRRQEHSASQRSTLPSSPFSTPRQRSASTGTRQLFKDSSHVQGRLPCQQNCCQNSCWDSKLTLKETRVDFTEGDRTFSLAINTAAISDRMKNGVHTWSTAQQQEQSIAVHESPLSAANDREVELHSQQAATALPTMILVRCARYSAEP